MLVLQINGAELLERPRSRANNALYRFRKGMTIREHCWRRRVVTVVGKPEHCGSGRMRDAGWLIVRHMYES